MTRPAWPADDIGRTGPATMPVKYHPAEAATEVGADDDNSDPHAAPRGIVHALIATAVCALIALALAALWGAK